MAVSNAFGSNIFDILLGVRPKFLYRKIDFLC